MSAPADLDLPPALPAVDLEHAFSVLLHFGEVRAFTGPAGRRVYAQVAGGRVWGPRLSGRVLPHSGGDYADAYGIKAHYLLEASDGTPIYLFNRGYLRTAAGDRVPTSLDEWDDADTYFRVCPTFDTPVGKHDWLTRTLVIGTGQRRPGPPEQMLFTYYEVR